MRACYYIVPFLPHLDVEYVCFLHLPPFSCVPCAESVYVVSLMIFDDFYGYLLIWAHVITVLVIARQAHVNCLESRSPSLRADAIRQPPHIRERCFFRTPR